MLGIRLSAEAADRVARHAREVDRPKSVIARDWIIERLERESIDEEMRRASRLIAETTTAEELDELDEMTDSLLGQLDEEDGGYDWGPAGPPMLTRAMSSSSAAAWDPRANRDHA